MTKRKPTHRVEIWVPADDHAKWTAVAKETGGSIARMLRTAVREVGLEKLAEIMRRAA